ncbi:hypothetical protein PHMEG_0008204 [Phytophthora megakarya]|uniref:GOST seven transmembrane domain-containing protein n=1 Tax=Phytophthora megakarya TaxID=4795 RepID=A0A225WJB3_9STRA|nr:hypothetical protein PHMEG_0008204 [Phytophthora megakarya]
MRLWWTLHVVFFIMLYIVEAVETAFDLRFAYEDVKPLVAQATVGSPRVRWNTRSVISGFGMENGARLELQVTGLHVVAENNLTIESGVPVVFTLYDTNQWRAYAVIKLREVHIRSDYVLCHFPAVFRYVVPPPDPTEAIPWTVSFVIPKSSKYTLQAQICGDASGRASMINVGYDGLLSEHLGVEELGLHPLYKVLFVVYFAVMGLWMLECYIRRHNVSKLCYVFQAVLLAKALSIALKIAYYRGRSLHGEVYAVLDFAQDLGESVASSALLGVSVLGSLGWSITRARLSRKETLSLLLFAVIYIGVIVSKALCRPTGTPQCRGVLLSEYSLQSMMMLGVIVALNFTIAQLKDAVNYERWNCFVTPITYMKLDQFQCVRYTLCYSFANIHCLTRRFRVIFLGYLLMPTFLCSLLVITPPGNWRYAWVNTLLSEVTTLVVLINIGLVARPVDRFIYSQIARNTSPDTSNRDGTDPIDPPLLGANMI